MEFTIINQIDSERMYQGYEKQMIKTKGINNAQKD